MLSLGFTSWEGQEGTRITWNAEICKWEKIPGIYKFLVAILRWRLQGSLRHRQGPLSVICCSLPASSNYYSSEAPWPVVTIFYVKPLALGERKFGQMVRVCWTKWLLCTYMKKFLLKSSPKPRNRAPRKLV